MQRAELVKAKRWVVKIGSALLTNDGQGLNREAMADWVKQMVTLRQAGVEVVLVSSGAVAEGIKRLGWTSRPKELPALQAAAAVGQMGLAQAWESLFANDQIMTAQVLLTHEDLSDRRRYLNARSTLNFLLEQGVIPVINENDTVATDEIRLGDNDTLGALVANLVGAEVLAILTDQQGLFTADPRSNPDACLLHAVKVSDPAIVEMASPTGGALVRGGMATKVRAAQRAARSGTVTLIAAGREAGVLERLRSGEVLGTLFEPDVDPMPARKQWLGSQLQSRGTLTLDGGAAKALREQGKSLLPVGVMAVSGSFSRGDVVICVDAKGVEIARGLANYAADEAKQLMGQPTHAIEAILGYMDDDCLIHRDNLVLSE
ncbi:MAG: glutamate 5-kinase [Thiotrichales bacterium]|nr:MAG: glutamate 5-kinase [Thiotrichales bacterium]